MKSRCTAFVFLLLALQQASAQPGVNLDTKIKNLLATAVHAHHHATTYREWAESPYQPEHFAELLSKQKKQHYGFHSALCTVLQKTPAVDLFYFSEYLQQKAAQSACIAREHRRYLRYLKNQQAKISGSFIMSDPEKKLGPSQEILLENKKNPLIVDGDLPEKTLVLTFDDGPHATRTQELLDLLASEDAQVQFFLVGQNSLRYPELIRQQQASGHEIGCHSNTHADLRKLSLKDGIAEIENGFAAITEALGVPGVFFRFPYGASTTKLRAHLAATESPEFLWNIDTLDWKYKDPSFLIEYALDQVKAEGQGVVLFHD
ncbi:MAG: polysaccharide deacetylase family protein, partial [Bdellovibrionales bacterium]